MADLISNNNKFVAPDLQITTQTQTDKNYYNFKATGLKLNKVYAIKFQWVYKDGKVSAWSQGYPLSTNNELTPTAPTGITVPSTATGAIPVELTSFPTNAKRVDVYIIGGMFGTGKVAYSFTTAGKTTIAADAGSYQVQLITVTPSGITSTASATYSITISTAGETVQPPTNPNGFSAKKILGGIEVSWDGTYSNGSFTGFEAIKVYVGTSASATPGTYKEAGVLSSNNVKNTINIAVDGIYLTYGQTAYIHAAAVNRSGAIGTIQSNVASVSGGAGKATDADINDGAVVISKLASNVLFVDNLKAGTINSNSYIRSGNKTGARIELSGATSNITTEIDPISGTVSSLTYPVKPGLTIYGTNGSQELLRADYNGNLVISGDISGSTGTLKNALSIGTYNLGLWGGRGYPFSVDSSGNLEAGSGVIGKWVINSGKLASSSNTFPKIELDPSPISSNPQIILRTIDSNSESGNAVKLNTTDGIRVGSYNNPNFTVSMDGTMVANAATITGKIISTGSNPNSYTGTLTIDAGWIKQTSQLYFDSPSFFVSAASQVNFTVNDGTSYDSAYLDIQPSGQAILGGGNATGDLQFRISPAPSGSFPGVSFQRGYYLWGLTNPEFADSTTNNAFVGHTVTADFDGRLLRGRRLFSGAYGSATSLNSNIPGADTGDLYFSTA